MNPLKSQSYPKTAKFILAAFVLLVAWGPSIMHSADKKTRSHITATSGRVQQRSDAEEKMKSSQSELERNAEIAKHDWEKAERLAADQRIKHLAEKLLAVQKAEQARLDKKLRSAEEKLEKQREEEQRKAKRESSKQLAEEERFIRLEIEKRIVEELVASERELKGRLLAEEQAMFVVLQEKVAAEKRLATEALQDRLEDEEKLEFERIQAELREKEEAYKDKILAKLNEEELAAKKKIEKEISEKARAARKDIDNRLDERERLAKAEIEKRVELESEQARKEIQDKLRGVEIAKHAALRVTLEQEEREALVEIEKRLEAQKLQLSERKQAENVIKIRELVDRDSRDDSNKIKVPKLGYDRSTKEDGYKRPSIWGSFSRAPKRLWASIGSISMPSKETYSGYLAFRAPPPLRFSDDISLIKRPPSPALPEFSILAPGRGSLTVETHLSDEEARKLALMNQVVFELEQHTIISGNIDTTIPREIEERDRLLIEESEESVIRPEEVLIFFENKRDGNNTRTIVPFSPAQPSQNPPAKSGASYNRN